MRMQGSKRRRRTSVFRGGVEEEWKARGEATVTQY